MTSTLRTVLESEMTRLKLTDRELVRDWDVSSSTLRQIHSGTQSHISPTTHRRMEMAGMKGLLPFVSAKAERAKRWSRSGRRHAKLSRAAKRGWQTRMMNQPPQVKEPSSEGSAILISSRIPLTGKFILIDRTTGKIVAQFNHVTGVSCVG